MSPDDSAPLGEVSTQKPYDLKTPIFMALTILNEIKAVAFDALRQKHKGPALLLLYSFIDICASLANGDPTKSNSARFIDYLEKHALSRWLAFRPVDLWAARCGLLHAFTPMAELTKKPDGAKPIFYYAWPEKRDEIESLLRSRGHQDILLVDVEHIKGIALSAFNSLFIELERDPALESIVASNAPHLLRMNPDIRLERFMEWVSEEKSL